MVRLNSCASCKIWICPFWNIFVNFKSFLNDLYINLLEIDQYILDMVRLCYKMLFKVYLIGHSKPTKFWNSLLGRDWNHIAKQTWIQKTARIAFSDSMNGVRLYFSSLFSLCCCKLIRFQIQLGEIINSSDHFWLKYLAWQAIYCVRRYCFGFRVGGKAANIISWMYTMKNES